MGNVKKIMCEACNGTGQRNGNTCPRCKGRGQTVYEELSRDEAERVREQWRREGR